MSALSDLGVEDVTVAQILERVVSSGFGPAADWDADTTVESIRVSHGDLAVFSLIGVCENATGMVWPVSLIDNCDTVGMFVDFVNMKRTVA